MIDDLMLAEDDLADAGAHLAQLVAESVDLARERGDIAIVGRCCGDHCQLWHLLVSGAISGVGSGARSEKLDPEYIATEWMPAEDGDFTAF